MPDMLHHITRQDISVATPDGRLFVRVWSPESDAGLAPVILFHDSLGSVELWRNFPADLVAATGRTVIAYDRLGFGKSDAHPERLALDFIAGEAASGFAALRQQLGIGRCVLFGHSVGGGMAVNCAARYDADCVALITESAQAFVEARTIQGIEEAREAFKDPAQIERLGRYHGAKARWVLDAWIGSWLHPDFASWSLQAVLPAVKAPALVIHGSDDEYGSPRHPELIGAGVGGSSQVMVMPGTRHVPHREKPETVVGLVAAFLQPLP